MKKFLRSRRDSTFVYIYVHICLQRQAANRYVYQLAPKRAFLVAPRSSPLVVFTFRECSRLAIGERVAALVELDSKRRTLQLEHFAQRILQVASIAIRNGGQPRAVDHHQGRIGPSLMSITQLRPVRSLHRGLMRRRARD